ncbi:MAG: hypothetical protein C3F13_02790 [Anaerolineales bacterium]|nr:MAG: hypothetical protein C3F13_02790 [Anaerolineales bacterium]
MSVFEYTLSQTICGHIMDIVERDGKVCLLSGDSDRVWVVPLICPVCGQTWHFVSDDMGKTLVQLRRKLKRFELVAISYIGQTTVEQVEQLMAMAYADTSVLFQDLVDEVPTHVEFQKEFPGVSLILQRRHRKQDDEDIMLVVHPMAVFEAVEIIGWQDTD